jgi:hypothetical protein
MFVPTNCTNEFHLVDVIIQQPLKHVFKVNFNKWTTDVIKQQIYNEREPLIDFKMNNLKPQICGWLYSTTEVHGMVGMIIKGWEKIGITKAFTPYFQIKALEANAFTPLFTFTPKVEKYNDIEDNKIDPIDSIVVVIENCLQHSSTPFGVEATRGCTSTSINVKMS